MLNAAKRPAYELYRNFRIGFPEPNAQSTDSKVSIFLNNENNHPRFNDRGYDIRVGGYYPDDPKGILVSRYDQYKRYEIEPIQNLNTWFMGCNKCQRWDWFPHVILRGPFRDGQFVKIPKI